ncbi:MAG: SEC-C domain-containing protein [Opitutaceae bacterium]|nr:SEC-C domain-containing protein [Opitutaceae bacterium]
MHIHATELRDTILGLYDLGLAEINYIEPEYAANALASTTPDPYESEHLDRTITDAWQTVRGWPFFQPESARAPAGPPPPQHGRTFSHTHIDSEGRSIPFSAPPKVGRNEPCPCGSGKKFKRCCGA